MKIDAHIIFIVVFIYVVSLWIVGHICYAIGKEEEYEKGYKECCIDFYKGKIKYDLVKHEDGTVSWEKINKKEGKNEQKKD